MPGLEFAPSQKQIDKGAADLAANPYPGRVAIMGVSLDEGLFLQAYALTGRSAGSKNRVFKPEAAAIRTVAPGKTPAEMAQVENAELIYYRAMDNRAGVHVVSNGAQTDPVLASIVDGCTLEQAVRQAPTVNGINLAHFEPDAPNFTPRITGVLDLREDAKTVFGLAIVRKDQASGRPQYSLFEAGPDLVQPGVGYGIQTYAGNGDPLPSYDQAPYAYPLGKTTADTAHRLWETLNQDVRVGVVVRGICLATGAAIETTIISGH